MRSPCRTLSGAWADEEAEPNRAHTLQCNSTGGDCFYRAYSSAVTAAREWYRFHYVNILALMPTAREDSHQSHGGHFVFSCRFDGQDCQAR